MKTTAAIAFPPDTSLHLSVRSGVRSRSGGLAGNTGSIR